MIVKKGAAGKSAVPVERRRENVKYEMIIHVENADDMATIIQACKGTAELKSAKAIESSPPQRRRGLQPRVEPRPAKPRIGAMRGEDIMREIFADGKNHTNDELKKTFVARGFQPNSVSPLLSRLKNSTSEIRMVAMGEYIKTSKLKPVATNSGGGAE